MANSSSVTPLPAMRPSLLEVEQFGGAPASAAGTTPPTARARIASRPLQSVCDDVSCGPRRPSARASTSAYTGKSRVSRCARSLNRSAMNDRIAADPCPGPRWSMGMFATMSKRYPFNHHGPPSISRTPNAWNSSARAVTLVAIICPLTSLICSSGLRLIDASAKAAAEGAGVTCACGIARATVIEAAMSVATAPATANAAARRCPMRPRVCRSSSNAATRAVRSSRLAIASDGGSLPAAGCAIDTNSDA